MIENIKTIFENKIMFKIHGPNIETEDADCEFSTSFTDEKEPNTCTLKIYNLNEENTKAVLENTQFVEIYTNQYGVKDSDGTVLWQLAFEGTLKSAVKKTKNKTKYLKPSVTTGESGADDYVVLELQEGKGADIGIFVSKSYRSGFNVKKILTDLAQNIGMEIVFDSNVRDFKLTYPVLLHSNTRDALYKVASYINASCSIANNRVYISSNVPGNVAFYYQFDETNIPQPKMIQGKKIEFTTPYMPTLAIGSYIKLVNKKLGLDGGYKICKLESTMSNHSTDCETKVTVKY